MRKVFTGIIAFLCFFEQATAQQNQAAWDSAVRNYIQEYKGLAIEEQIRSGVPAAVTLAQGIFETSAGQSELCVNAANHFGIKCKGNWTGDTYTYDDDAPNECFRKYKTVLDSYRDHSDFLRRNTRYQQLFSLQATDYQGWANGLLKAGYATNKAYATRLISFIEQYDLNQYTEDALNGGDSSRMVGQTTNQNQDIFLASADPTLIPDPVVTRSSRISYDQKTTTDTTFYQTTEKNGLKGFYAPKGDLLLNYAITHRIRYGKLLSINNLPDEPLEANMFIYLEKKLKSGIVPSFTVASGMDLVQVSQETGVDLNEIRRLNLLKEGEEPVEGTVLVLREPAVSRKPQIRNSMIGNLPSKSVSSDVNNNQDDYIVLHQDDEPAPAPNQSAATTVTQTNQTDNQEAAPAVPHNVVNQKQPALIAAGQPEVSLAKEEVPIQKEKSKKEASQKAQVADTPITKAERLKSMMDKIVYRNGEPESTGRSKETNVIPQNRQESPKTIENNQETDEQQTNPTERLRNYMDNIHPRTVDDEAETPPTVKVSAGGASVQNSEKLTPANGRFYTVQRGDTAFSIAKRFGITLDQLKKWNHLPASMAVPLGKELQVAP